MKYTNAIVKSPCKNIVNALTTSRLGEPDLELALHQHHKYVEALEKCGLEVYVLEADEQYPDSTFIEDIAIVTPQFAVITNPGAPSRKGETEKVYECIKNHFNRIDFIKDPGALDGGDVMMAGSHFYIGLSNRTNENGAGQLIGYLNKGGMTGSTVRLNNFLHLKSGAAYLENNNIALGGELVNEPDFDKYKLIRIHENETYAANCIWVNEKVIIAVGYPKTKNAIINAGYETLEVDVSEFRKLDGGLSCLSLRW